MKVGDTVYFRPNAWDLMMQYRDGRIDGHKKTWGWGNDRRHIISDYMGKPLSIRYANSIEGCVYIQGINHKWPNILFLTDPVKEYKTKGKVVVKAL